MITIVYGVQQEKTQASNKRYSFEHERKRVIKWKMSVCRKKNRGRGRIDSEKNWIDRPSSCFFLPVNFGGEVFSDERLVVRAELLDIARLVVLTVQVIRIKRPHGLKRLRVLLVREVCVRALAMPGVEAVVADHREALLGQRALVLQDGVEVLVVPPREHHVVQPAVRRVDPVRRGVDGVMCVWVGGEGLGVDDLVGEGAPDDEGVLWEGGVSQ